MRKAQEKEAKEMEQRDAPPGEVRDIRPKDSVSQASKESSKPGDAQAEPLRTLADVLDKVKAEAHGAAQDVAPGDALGATQADVLDKT